jgi:uncharacterized membrane protein
LLFNRELLVHSYDGNKDLENCGSGISRHLSIMVALQQTEQDRTTDKQNTFRILSVIAFTFIVYFSIGTPLALLPMYAHEQLGVVAYVAGFLVSLQYIATYHPSSLASVKDRSAIHAIMSSQMVSARICLAPTDCARKPGQRRSNSPLTSPGMGGPCTNAGRAQYANAS